MYTTETKFEKAERILKWDCLCQHSDGVLVKGRVLIVMESEPIKESVKVLVFKKFTLTYKPGKKSKSGSSYWMELVNDDQADLADAYSKKRTTVRDSDKVIVK